MFHKTLKIILGFFLLLAFSACGPSESAEQTVAAETESAFQTAVSGTLTAEPTNTPKPATPTPTPLPTATPTPFPVLRDDFSGELQPGWSWIRENQNLWSLTSEPGYLRIVLTGGKYPRNLLVREVASDNFQIVTHLLFTPTSNFQFAGLLVYQDDENLIQLGRAYCNLPNTCVGNGIYFDMVQSGQGIGPNFETNTQLVDEAYLRIDKVGLLFTGYYSEDGENWIAIGEHDFFMADPKVGLIAGQSNVEGRFALFDYFSIVEMP